jgi:hypothetical protein
MRKNNAVHKLFKEVGCFVMTECGRWLMASEKRATERRSQVTCGQCRRRLDPTRFPSSGPVLVLTRGERDAIDWIGGRYFHGAELRDLLHAPGVVQVVYDAQPNPDDQPWYDGDYRGDIGFRVPSEVRNAILRGFESERFGFACLNTFLANKLEVFAECEPVTGNGVTVRTVGER